MKRSEQMRNGDWIQTFTGRAFWPLDPRPEDIEIADIAHALSFQCRFGGHSTRFYSVAEHCFSLASFFTAKGEREMARWALLHDAAEAYLVDVPRPIKGAIPQYRDIEAAVMGAICSRFGLPLEEPAAVREADRRILTDEARALMGPPPMRWATESEPLGVTIYAVAPWEAEQIFMHWFGILFQTVAALP
jgi:hypothetical protein